MLVPCRPSPDDLAAAAGVVGALAKHPQWAFVLTQTLPRSRLTDGAIRQLATLGRVARAAWARARIIPLLRLRGWRRSNFLAQRARQRLSSCVAT